MPLSVPVCHRNSRSFVPAASFETVKFVPQASALCQPEIPKTSVATLANLMLAVSGGFSRRLRSAA
jgi:hypothetical protein